MFIKEEIQRIKANNPDISHSEAFSTAAKNVFCSCYISLRIKRSVRAMAEEIPVSSVALANGKNESYNKEFPDAVALPNGENESNDKEFPDAVALANGENESNDKEFPDDVAVEEENTSDKDAATAGAVDELLIKKIEDLNKMRLDLRKKIYDLKAELQNLRKEDHDFKAELQNLIKRLLDFHKERANERTALAVGVAVGALALITLNLFKQK